jgi:meso-butanediol dehydrogenase/(S,S)-butanediol dehydrogenase/diacetyl reductase
MYELDGKSVLVTGVAGDIGAAIAEAFLQRGARVYATDIDTDGLERRIQGLAGQGEVTGSVCDLADPVKVAQLADAAIARFGHVDVLVNNAAIQATGDLEACTPELFDLAYAVNVRAPYLLARALAPGMRAAGGGAIVNISSVHATAPGPGRLAYATTKTALLGMTRALAVDLGPDNIRVNAVSPGATLTTQLQSAWDKLSAEGVDVMAHAVKQHPLGRIAQVSDIAGAVLYLAESTFMHGAELRVDGGLLSSLRLLPPQGS